LTSTPGHFMHLELTGDVMLVHKGHGGRISGVLLKVDLDDAPIEIVIMSNRWPEGVVPGCRLAVRGRLCQEKGVLHRKNLHYVVPTTQLAVVRRWQGHYQPERGAR
jgi:hypothetical protein